MESKLQELFELAAEQQRWIQSLSANHVKLCEALESLPSCIKSNISDGPINGVKDSLPRSIKAHISDSPANSIKENSRRPSASSQGISAPRNPATRVAAQNGSEHGSERSATPTGELLQIIKHCGESCATRFTNLRSAWRSVDKDHSNFITRDELAELMTRCGVRMKAEVAADMLFEFADKDRSGTIDFLEFQRILGHYIQPGSVTTSPRPQSPSSNRAQGRDQARSKSPQASGNHSLKNAAKSGTYSRSFDALSQASDLSSQPPSPELAQIIQHVGEAAAVRFTNLRAAWRSVDRDHSNSITRDELVNFMIRCGVQVDIEAAADMFFEYADKDGNAEIDFREMQRILGPYIQPGPESPRRSVSPRPPSRSPSPQSRRPSLHRAPAPLSMKQQQSPVYIGPASGYTFDQLDNMSRDKVARMLRDLRDHLGQDIAVGNNQAEMIKQVLDLQSQAVGGRKPREQLSRSR